MIGSTLLLNLSSKGTWKICNFSFPASAGQAKQERLEVNADNKPTTATTGRSMHFHFTDEKTENQKI